MPSTNPTGRVKIRKAAGRYEAALTSFAAKKGIRGWQWAQYQLNRPGKGNGSNNTERLRFPPNLVTLAL